MLSSLCTRCRSIISGTQILCASPAVMSELLYCGERAPGKGRVMQHCRPKCSVLWEHQVQDGVKAEIVLDSELLESFFQTFAGYGNAAAPYWYVGMEEGGDSTEASLKRRLELWRERGSSTLEDLRDYHLSTVRLR
jgi:hypothetical protein